LNYITSASMTDTIKNYINENTLSVGDNWYWKYLKKALKKYAGIKIVIEKELVKTEPKK